MNDIKLTAEAAQKLIDAGGTTCPKCGSQDVSVNDCCMAVSDAQITRHASCDDCGSQWDLQYELTQVHNWIDGGEVKKRKAEGRKTDKEIGAALNSIQQRVGEAIEDGDRRVYYSAYDSDDRGVPIDNLDQVAVEGRVKFVAEPGWSHEGRRYESQEVENPTWLQVAVLANDMILVVDDYHHRFLEGVYADGKKPGVYHFLMGS